MSVTSSAAPRVAAAAVLTAAVAAVVYPTATAFAAQQTDRDTRPGGPGTTTVQQVLLPDGSRARLTSGSGGTSVTVTRGTQHRTLDTGRPATDLDRLHLRILGGNTTRPTLSARLDGSRLPTYYDFASGATRHTLDAGEAARPAATASGTRTRTKDHRTLAAGTTGGATTVTVTPHTPAAGSHRSTGHHGKPPHDSSGNPVKRVVEAGQVIKASHDAGEVGTPVVVGGIALLAAGGAYGVRVALRRGGRTAG
ncbi:hypothetical protein [Streptomyces sp. NPDC049585]|uniref:hypothetical protein n=1 Tax=Streptomyces sp. NPDC049585 TaxID=3155154 RepID=UPI00343E57FD